MPRYNTKCPGDSEVARAFVFLGDVCDLSTYAQAILESYEVSLAKTALFGFIERVFGSGFVGECTQHNALSACGRIFGFYGTQFAQGTELPYIGVAVVAYLYFVFHAARRRRIYAARSGGRTARRGCVVAIAHAAASVSVFGRSYTFRC